MAKQHRYAIRTTVFESGERMPILVDASTGLPMVDPCVYVCTEIRPNSGSAATIEQALRGVQFLLTFVGEREIDLSERFSVGRFLDLHELDDLLRTAYLPYGGGTTFKAIRDANDPTPKVLSLEQARMRSPRPKKSESTVSMSTVAIRLYYASTYLKWIGHRTARQVCKTLDQKHDYLDLLHKFLSTLRARTPKARGYSSRVGQSKNEKSELARVVDPACVDNPWHGDFVRDRNRLIVLWGMGTGLRRGELLGLRIKLLDFRRNTADIMRRPDDKKDPRTHQPNTKTRERGIGISEELAYLTHQHITKYRSKVRGAQKHDFLFVATSTGRPLSLAGLSKVFRSIRQRHPSVGEALTSHVLRHTWNEEFSDVADHVGLTEDDERRARNHAMGWSEFSKSADHYLKRRTSCIATEASIRIQQSVVQNTAVKEKR